jgi:hypothetical protein
MMRRGLVLAMMAMLLMAGMVQAELLNLRVTYPLITADFLTARYDNDGAGANGKFTATAWTDNWNPNGSGSVGLNTLGDFNLEIVIVPDDGQAVSGTLYMTGDSNNDLVSELLVKSGKILAFGFGIDDKFEAKFEQEDGTLAPAGAVIGLIINAQHIPAFGPLGSPVMPYFTIDFSTATTGLRKVDLFVMPEPATVWLTVSGLIVLAVRRRWRVGRAGA